MLPFLSSSSSLNKSCRACRSQTCLEHTHHPPTHIYMPISIYLYLSICLYTYDTHTIAAVLVLAELVEQVMQRLRTGPNLISTHPPHTPPTYIFLYIYIYVSASVYIHIPIYISIYLHLSIYTFLYIYLSICICLYTYSYIYIYLSASVYIHRMIMILLPFLSEQVVQRLRKLAGAKPYIF